MKIEPNIYYEPNNCKQKPYAVTIKIAKKIYKRSFSNLDDAQKFKNEKKLLRNNRCKNCNKITDKFNTKFCSDCHSAAGVYNLSNKVKFGSSYAFRLTTDEEAKESAHGNIEVKCYKCRKYFEPTLSQIIGRVSVLEGRSDGSKYIYCSDKCKKSCTVFGQKTWPKDYQSVLNCVQDVSRMTQRWSKKDIINEQLKDYGFIFCEKCGKKYEELDLHHTEPVNNRDIDKSLNPLTHIVLCKGCHDSIHSKC